MAIATYAIADLCDSGLSPFNHVEILLKIEMCEIV